MEKKQAQQRAVKALRQIIKAAKELTDAEQILIQQEQAEQIAAELRGGNDAD